SAVDHIGQIPHLHRVGGHAGEIETQPAPIVGADPGGELPPAERVRHVDRLGEVGDLVLGDRQGDQLRRHAQGVQVESGGVGRVDGDGRGRAHRVGPDAPAEEADVADVVAAAPAADPADV